MAADEDDRLGMNRPIARRDFIQGAAITAASLAAGLRAARAAPQDVEGYDPPILTGMRGSHPGSFEAAHALRDGKFWTHADTVRDADSYDLVIVGAGISGLAAAHFYRAEQPQARILILDNHDDFGGHAKRNEFHQDGRLELMNGGTLEIDSPRPYSPVADGLLKTLGIDPPALEKAHADKSFYPGQGMGEGIFFCRNIFGADRTVSGVGTRPWREVLETAPLSARVKEDLIRIQEGKTDYMNWAFFGAEEGSPLTHEFPRLPAEHRQGRSRHHRLLPGPDA